MYSINLSGYLAASVQIKPVELAGNYVEIKIHIVTLQEPKLIPNTSQSPTIRHNQIAGTLPRPTIELTSIQRVFAAAH